MTDLHLLRVCLSLLAVVGLLLATLWLLRRPGRFGSYAGGGRQQGRRPTLLHTQPLGAPRTQLALVRIDTEELLLGITPNQITLLHALPHKESVAAKAHAPAAQRGAGFAGAAGTVDGAEPFVPVPSPSRFASIFEQVRAQLWTQRRRGSSKAAAVADVADMATSAVTGVPSNVRENPL